MASINFTTAETLINTKIERNHLMIKIYETENKLIEKEMIIRYRLLDRNKRKIEEIKKINSIEEKQKEKYCPIRASEISMITEIINNMEIDLNELKNDCINLMNAREELISKLEYINSQIPNMTMITNFQCKLAS